MQIKTIREQRAPVFDEEVNRAMAEGYHLSHRGIVPCPTNPHNTLFYAELVKPGNIEYEPEVDTIDPMMAARAIKAFCATVDAAVCKNDQCPLAEVCDSMGNHTPDIWVIPEV